MLFQFEITGKGKNILWPLLGEDLSLKAILRDKAINLVKKDKVAA
ncbi:MAG: hypothetical protein ACXWWC_13600 [Chitinophagaceae bacterium]